MDREHVKGAADKAKGAIKSVFAYALETSKIDMGSPQRRGG